MEGWPLFDFSRSTGSMVSSSDVSVPSAQPQSTSHPSATTSSSSVTIAESTDPSGTFVGALDAMQQTVSPVISMEVTAPPSEALETSTEPSTKRKGAGKRLTDRQRVEILDLIEKSNGSLSNAEIARRYGITRAAIQKLKQKGPEVRARYRYGSADSRDGRKRGGLVLSVPFERELFEWVRGLKARKVPVPPSLVKEKAKLLVPKYGLGNFQASNGWYYNFCKRFSLTTGVLVEEKTPETATVDDVDSSLDADQAELQQMTINALEQQTYEQMQQYQHQMAATLQHQQEQLQQVQEQQKDQHQQQVQEQQQVQHQQEDSTQGQKSKTDRMLELLEQQNVLLERQNSMIEDQAKTITRLFGVVTKGGTTL